MTRAHGAPLAAAAVLALTAACATAPVVPISDPRELAGRAGAGA